MKFTDKYATDLFLDLSKALFVFSFNIEENCNSYFKEDPYDIFKKKRDFKVTEKVKSSQLKISPNDFNIKQIDKFSDDVREYIFNNYFNKNYDMRVRKFKQILKTLVSKLNMIKAKSNKNVLKRILIEIPS